MARFWKLLVLICFLIIIDQVTKGWVQSSFQEGQTQSVIEGVFNFTYVKNKGAAFGFGNDAPELQRKLMFLVVPTLFSAWVVWMLLTTLRGAFYISLAYALILAGAVGNLIDRFSLGYVVDFLHFYWHEHHFPAFNVADSCITVAAFLLIWDVIQHARRGKGGDKSVTPGNPS